VFLKSAIKKMCLAATLDIVLQYVTGHLLFFVAAVAKK